MGRSEIERLVDFPLDELLSEANKVRRDNIGDNIDVCGVINAKSGACSEDCKFCAQSAHYNTQIEDYSLKNKKTLVEAARVAKNNKAKRFGIVTSGNKLTAEEINVIANAISDIKNEVGIIPCASLGALDEQSFLKLKAAGLARYHHNIETSERFYPSIVSTHDYKERVVQDCIVINLCLATL